MEKFLVPIPHLPHHSGEWSRDTQSHSYSPNVPCYLSMMSSCRVRASTVPSNQVLPMGSPVDPAAPHSGIPVPWRRPTLIDPPPAAVSVCVSVWWCLQDAQFSIVITESRHGRWQVVIDRIRFPVALSSKSVCCCCCAGK